VSKLYQCNRCKAVMTEEPRHQYQTGDCNRDAIIVVEVRQSSWFHYCRNCLAIEAYKAVAGDVPTVAVERS
jgi:hypothetical protein